MKFGTWLVAMVQPLLAKILLSLGFSVVSIVGMTSVIGGLKASFLSQAALIPAAGLQLATLAGCGVAIGIIFGAITTRILLWQISQGTKLLGSAT